MVDSSFKNIFVTIFLVCVTLCSSQCPYGILDSKLSSSDINGIVNKHNNLRSLISNGKVPGQPRGTNLKKMTWDPELARTAQKIANTCKFAHSKVTDGRWGFVGQNLYTGYSTAPLGSGANFNDAIQAWFDEYKKYSFTYPYYFQDTGHYTQVVWADSTNVGCGYTYFKTNNGIYSYQKLYVCNYGPGGNIVGQPPYKKA